MPKQTSSLGTGARGARGNFAEFCGQTPPALPPIEAVFEAGWNVINSGAALPAALSDPVGLPLPRGPFFRSPLHSGGYSLPLFYAHHAIPRFIEAPFSDIPRGTILRITSFYVLNFLSARLQFGCRLIILAH